MFCVISFHFKSLKWKRWSILKLYWSILKLYCVVSELSKYYYICNLWMPLHFLWWWFGGKRYHGYMRCCTCTTNKCPHKQLFRPKSITFDMYYNFRYEYLFNFDNTFEIHDDIEVLKRMGMAFGLEKNQCSMEDVRKAVKMVPKALEPYVLGRCRLKSCSSRWV